MEERRDSSASSDGGTVVVKLLNNYRSHSDILEIPSQLFYDGELRACANPLETDSLCEWEELADAEYMDELEAHLSKRGLRVAELAAVGRLATSLRMEYCRVKHGRPTVSLAVLNTKHRRGRLEQRSVLEVQCLGRRVSRRRAAVNV